MLVKRISTGNVHEVLSISKSEYKGTEFLINEDLGNGSTQLEWIPSYNVEVIDSDMMSQIEPKKISDTINYLQKQIDTMENVPFCSKEESERYQCDKFVLDILKHLV